MRLWLRWAVVMAGYWLRPYDAHLDARRWRWAKSGCRQSREWWARHGSALLALIEPKNQPASAGAPTPAEASTDPSDSPEGTT